MSSEHRDDPASDAADAVAWNRAVPWDRWARRATPAGRRTLDNLRALVPIFAKDCTADPDVGVADPAADGFVHRAVTMFVAIAALEVAVVLVLLPWSWGDYYRAHGPVAVYLRNLLCGHGAGAALLFVGRPDRRTWLLGCWFLCQATIAPLHMLPGLLGHMPAPDQLQASIWAIPGPIMAWLHLCGFPLAFGIPPAFLWAFARECPRVHRHTPLDSLARWMVPVSVAVGGVMCLGMASVYVAGLVFDAVGGAEYVALLDATIAVPSVLTVAAVVVVVLRARTAEAAEVRRVILFSVGFLAWAGLGTAYHLVEALSPGFWVSNYDSNSVLQLIQPMRFPGMVLLWYGVLAARVPHPREVVRRIYRRLLRRRGGLWLAAVGLGAVLGWHVVSQPERAVGTVLADPLAQGLSAAMAILLLLLASREEILARLDSWIDPDTADQPSVLASATATLGRAAGLSAVSRTVERTVERGCGSPATLVVKGGIETDGRDSRAQDGQIPQLPAFSAISFMLETAGGSLRVHPGDATSVFVLLPSEEAAWVAQTAADVIVAVPGPGAELLGILVVGRRFDDRTVRPLDIPFLEAVGAATGIAVARLRLLEAPPAGASEPPAARECPACGHVFGRDEAGCHCGSAYFETCAPKLLAGKYLLTRLLGAGGMGAVYLARDLQLGRQVAIKTVKGVSVPRLMGLKTEAWAMATVAHAAVAQIYGIESWRGQPFIVVEHLVGGTLADRLRQGPVPVAEAVSLATVLGDALATLHRAGYLHGDVKPSNIGFTSEASPKLLDFGLAREPNDLDVRGGTLRYMSPEVLAGCPAEDADDVWSLCVVLHEMVSGQNPFAGGSSSETRDRIRQQQLAPDDGLGVSSTLPLAVLGFTASILTAPQSARLATARAFTDALDAVIVATQ